MVDSGIFGKDGCQMSYPELFDAYDAMGADYGIMIDVYRNPGATLSSAAEAINEYRRAPRRFHLVGVAQGRTPSQYLRCYEKLINLGFQYIAIGGLLERRQNTVRYVYVRGKPFLETVLSKVRATFDPDWLFALGVFHPKRIPLFQQYRVWGSDFKGWIFNYVKRQLAIHLIRTQRVGTHPRVAVPELRITDVQGMTEQELRFFLTRNFVSRRVLDPLYGPDSG
jgi:hypothetical protein